MYSPEYFPRQRWSIPKDQERNFLAAFFHMATIALTCTSLAQLGWFRLRGGECAPHLAVYQFFNLGYFSKITRPSDSTVHGSKLEATPMMIQYYSPSGSLQCVTPEIANMMRILILLCFMAMMSSLVGFFLDIVGPTSKLYRCIRKNALPSIITVLWVISIIGVCYYITILLEEELRSMNLGSEVQVSFEYGCYTITAAGVVALLASACNLLQNNSPSQYDVQRQQLVGDWDGLESFSVGHPGADTPLENIPPPPYRP